METGPSRFDRWMTALKNNPVVAIVMILALVLGGIAALVKNVETLWGSSSHLYPSSSAASSAPSSSIGPHAASLPLQPGAVSEEKTLLLTIGSGQRTTLKMMDLWTAPTDAQGSCGNASVSFTWSVREPFPNDRDDLELLSLVPRGGGQTTQVARGAEGRASLGYCDELTLSNTGLQPYKVELRYGSFGGAVVR